MRKLLKKIEFVLLTFWYFIIGPTGTPETPDVENLKIPPIPYGLLKKGKWTKNEIFISLYLKVYGIETLGFSYKYIVQCLGRSEAAMDRKLHRLQDLWDKQPCEDHEYSRLDEEIFGSFKILSPRRAELEFLKRM